MTLTNPTDDELNAAFAEKVAGWTHVHVGEMESADIESRSVFCYDGLIGETGGKMMPVPQFTHSADAVLPWLEKCAWFQHTGVFSGANGRSIDNCREGHTIELSLTLDSMNRGAHAETLPRAAVIALLRAHGVVVEFTA